jgi:hypothetical protein
MNTTQSISPNFQTSQQAGWAFLEQQFVLGLERVFDGRGVQLYKGIQAPEVFG